MDTVRCNCVLPLAVHGLKSSPWTGKGIYLPENGTGVLTNYDDLRLLVGS